MTDAIKVINRAIQAYCKFAEPRHIYVNAKTYDSIGKPETVYGVPITVCHLVADNDVIITAMGLTFPGAFDFDIPNSI